MKFKTKYQIMLWKSYFDQGLSLVNILKYPLGFFALSSLNVKWTLILTFIFLILCFVLGWGFYKYGWVKAQIEVSNQYNLFVREVREKLKKRKILKS